MSLKRRPVNLMLSKNERMSRAVFRATFKKGAQQHTSHFEIIHIPAQHSRGSVVIPKKVVKTAVARNSLRRRIYHVLETLFKKVPLCLHVIVIAKKGSTTLSTSAIERELIEAFGKHQQSR